MASVWSATNVFTEREFAIKFMLPQVARTPEAARRFLMEAKVSARINHPNIIEVIDVGQAEDGALFLVMELLTGVSLEVAVRRQKPPMLRLRVRPHHARRRRRARGGAPQRRHPPRSQADEHLPAQGPRRARRPQDPRLRRQQDPRGGPEHRAHRRRHRARLAALHEPRAGHGRRGHRRADRRVRVRLDPLRGALRPARVRRAELQRAHRDDRHDAAEAHRRRRAAPARAAARARPRLPGDRQEQAPRVVRPRSSSASTR